MSSMISKESSKHESVFPTVATETEICSTDNALKRSSMASKLTNDNICNCASTDVCSIANISKKSDGSHVKDSKCDFLSSAVSSKMSKRSTTEPCDDETENELNKSSVILQVKSKFL